MESIGTPTFFVNGERYEDSWDLETFSNFLKTLWRGVSSFKGKAIREWASELYARVVDAQSRKRKQDTVSTPTEPTEKGTNSSNLAKDNKLYADKEYMVNNLEMEEKVEARVPMSAAPITIFSERRNDEVNNNSNQTEETKQLHKEETSNKNDDLIHTLKMRLVKGEISKEEYLELLKLIE